MMHKSLPSFFRAASRHGTQPIEARDLAELECLKKLSRPLLSLIAEYSQSYNKELDLQTLQKAKAASWGYNRLMIFLSAIKDGHIVTVRHLLESKMENPHRVIQHDFALPVPNSQYYNYDNQHHLTTPLIHAIKHKQFGIALFLTKQYKEKIKETINERFQTKEVILGTGSVGHPWISHGTALSYAIEACHLPTVLRLSDLSAEVAPDYCLTSLKNLLTQSETRRFCSTQRNCSI